MKKKRNQVFKNSSITINQNELSEEPTSESFPHFLRDGNVNRKHHLGKPHGLVVGVTIMTFVDMPRLAYKSILAK